MSKYLAQTGRKPTWIEKQFDELFSYGHILLHSVSMPLTSKIFLNILRIYQTLILSYKKNDTTGCPPEYDVIYYYRLLIDSLGTYHIFNKKCFFLISAAKKSKKNMMGNISISKKDRDHHNKLRSSNFKKF